MRTLMTALLASALLGAGAAQAAPTILHNEGMSGPEVAKWLTDLGYKAELGTDKSGDPMIKSGAEGISFDIYFYDCVEKPRCKAIQFSAGFDLKQPLTAAKINEWNRKNRYLKAYIDDEGDPHVEYDVNLNAGRTKEGLSDDFGVWTSMIGDFTKFIDW